MKKAKKGAEPLATTLTTDFTRGFVATGLLFAVQDRSLSELAADRRHLLRRSLQGGVALATGTAIARTLRDGSPLTAALWFAGGATALVAIEQLLQQQGAAELQEKL